MFFFLSRVSLLFCPECCFSVPFEFLCPECICLFCPDIRLLILSRFRLFVPWRFFLSQHLGSGARSKPMTTPPTRTTTTNDKQPQETTKMDWPKWDWPKVGHYLPMSSVHDIEGWLSIRSCELRNVLEFGDLATVTRLGALVAQGSNWQVLCKECSLLAMVKPNPLRWQR